MKRAFSILLLFLSSFTMAHAGYSRCITDQAAGKTFCFILCERYGWPIVCGENRKNNDGVVWVYQKKGEKVACPWLMKAVNSPKDINNLKSPLFPGCVYGDAAFRSN